MKTVNEYLDAIKQRHALPSDYALARLLRVSPANVTGYRKGKSGFDDERCLIVADLLDIDPVSVLADMNAARTKCPEARKVWERVARACSTTAAVFLVVFSMIGAQPAESAPNNLTSSNPNECLLCKIYCAC